MKRTGQVNDDVGMTIKRMEPHKYVVIMNKFTFLRFWK